MLAALLTRAPETQGASCPAARGGFRGCAFIRALKSSQRSWATLISAGGSLPVLLRKACRSTISRSERRYKHSVALGTHMTAKLTQLTVDLRAVWERQVRDRVGEIVQPVQLTRQRGAALDIETRDEGKHRLPAIRFPVVNGLKIAHVVTAETDAVVVVSRSAAESFSAASTWGTWWT